MDLGSVLELLLGRKGNQIMLGTNYVHVLCSAFPCGLWVEAWSRGWPVGPPNGLGSIVNTLPSILTTPPKPPLAKARATSHRPRAARRRSRRCSRSRTTPPPSAKVCMGPNKVPLHSVGNLTARQHADDMFKNCQTEQSAASATSHDQHQPPFSTTRISQEIHKVHKHLAKFSYNLAMTVVTW